MPLIGVHRLHLIIAAGADDPLGNAAGQRLEVVLPLVAVTADINAKLDIGAFHPVDHKRGQVGKAFHCFAAAADQHAHMFAADLENRGFALLDSGEGEVFRPHQLKDRGQVLNRSLQLRVVRNDKRGFGFRGGFPGFRCSRGFHGFRGGRGFRGFRGGRGFRGRLGRGRLRGGGGGRGFRFGHLHPHFGGDAAEQLAGREFQHFIADAEIIPVYAERAAGCFEGLLNGFGGHFNFAHHEHILSMAYPSGGIFRDGDPFCLSAGADASIRPCRRVPQRDRAFCNVGVALWVYRIHP